MLNESTKIAFSKIIFSVLLTSQKSYLCIYVYKKNRLSEWYSWKVCIFPSRETNRLADCLWNFFDFRFSIFDFRFSILSRNLLVYFWFLPFVFRFSFFDFVFLISFGQRGITWTYIEKAKKIPRDLLTRARAARPRNAGTLKNLARVPRLRARRG